MKAGRENGIIGYQTSRADLLESGYGNWAQLRIHCEQLEDRARDGWLSMDDDICAVGRLICAPAFILLLLIS